MRRFVAILTVLALAPLASAAVTDMQINEVDNSVGGAALSGYYTQDVVIDFDGEWLRWVRLSFMGVWVDVRTMAFV